MVPSHLHLYCGELLTFMAIIKAYTRKTYYNSSCDTLNSINPEFNINLFIIVPEPLKLIALGFLCFILFSSFGMKDQKGCAVSLL